MRSNTRKRQAVEELKQLLNDIAVLVDAVLVEGVRDIESLRRLGYAGEILSCSVPGVNDYDLMHSISDTYSSVLILTDFDQEGQRLNQHFSELLEREGVKVEHGLRKQVGRRTAALGVYAVESLDNMMDSLEHVP